MWVAYLIGFGLAFLLSLALTASMLSVAPRLGLMDHPSERKIHREPMPLGGGIAIVSSILIVVGIASLVILLLRARPGMLSLPESFEIHLPGLAGSLRRRWAVVVGAVALAIVGIIDDKRGVSAWTKLAVQILVGVLVVASGLSVSLFLPWRAAGWILTVGWLVFVTNSFNLLDNMDGLSGGVAFIIAAVFAAVAVITGQLFFGLFLVIFAGAVLGFLVFNFPPAKIFMGDAGSHVLGYFLGVLAIGFTFVPEGTSQASLLPLALPFILFAIPFYDTLSVVFIRIREGRHPFDADNRHFSHRLVDLGMNKREAVCTIYGATLVTAFPALYIHELKTYALLGAVAQAFLVLLLVAVLEHAGARKIP